MSVRIIYVEVSTVSIFFGTIKEWGSARDIWAMGMELGEGGGKRSQRADFFLKPINNL